MNQKGITPLIIVAIVAVVVVVAGVGIYAATRGGYPEISAVPTESISHIITEVANGSIPANEWEYSISSTSGSYTWTTGTVELAAPYVDLGTKSIGTWYVSLRHKASGHIYFADVAVIISPAIPPSATLSITAAENAENTSRVNLTIEHGGGSALALNDIKLIASTTGTNYESEPLYPNLTGQTSLTTSQTVTLSYPYGAPCAGQTIRVQLVHIPSNQKIFDRSGILVASA